MILWGLAKQISQNAPDPNDEDKWERYRKIVSQLMDKAQEYADQALKAMEEWNQRN
jgi:hypothetical protein